MEIRADYNQIKKLAKQIGTASSAKAVILFGSRAKGSQYAQSDVDLFVVADTDLPYYKRVRGLTPIVREYSFPVDLLLYTPEEFEQNKKDKYSVAYYASREGNVLYGKI